MKRVLWGVFGIIVLIVAAGFAVPHFAADRFGEGAKQALETSLGRKVEFGQVEYNLFTGPGFTLSSVVVYDDPALSAEPILYADKLTAIPRILPLFAGKLAFSSVRLEDAHINLGRTASPSEPPRWNVGALTRPALFQAFPNISVVSGGVRGIPKSRINFKIGGVKAPFYILIDSLEIHPPSSENGPWGIHLEGEPARTDRPALGFGSFIADGRWMPAQGLTDVTIHLERSEIGDMIALLNGHDAGIYGSVSGTARVAGHLDALKINGRLEVDGIHGWDQLASSVQWPLAIAGNWDLPGQLFELGARLAGQPDSPVQAHFRVADYLGAPHWGFGVTCHAMPLQPLVPLARQVGLTIPDGVELNGTLDGAVSMSRTGATEGSGLISRASLAVPGAPSLQFEDAQVMVVDGHARLLPSSFAPAAKSAPAIADDSTIQGDYDLGRRVLKLMVTSRGMNIAPFRRLAVVAGIPGLRDLESGVWKGQVSYSFDAASPAATGWTGIMDIQKAAIALPWFGAPVRVASAHVELDGRSLAAHKIQARAGDLPVTGDYRYQADALRPHQFHLSAVHVTGAQLEGLFRPILFRGGLVSRLGLKRSDVPDWLAHMGADGIVDIAAMDLGTVEFDHVTSRVIWDGPHVKLAAAKAHTSGGSVAALLEADLTGNAPAYHAAGDVAGMAWKGGKVDADLSLDTSGAGLETLSNLRAEGSFNARGMDANYTSMQGCFQFTLAGKAPRVKLSGLTLSDGEETFVGRGATSANGELVLDLAGVSKPVRLSLR